MSMTYAKELSLEALASVADADIYFSDIPELDENFWKEARQIEPAAQTAVKPAHIIEKE